MEQRSSRRKNGPVLQAIRHSVRFFRNYKQWNNRTFIVVLLASVAVSMMLTLLVEGARGISLSSSDPSSTHQQSSSQAKNAETEQETSARIMAMVICSIMTLFIFQPKNQMASMIFMIILSM